MGKKLIEGTDHSKESSEATKQSELVGITDQKNKEILHIFNKKEGFYGETNKILAEIKEKYKIKSGFKDIRGMAEEVLSNLRYYSYLGKEHEASFRLIETNGKYEIIIENYCNRTNYAKLIKLEELNSKDVNEINAMREQQAMHGIMNKKGGAGVGMYDLARKVKRDFPDSTEKIFSVEELGLNGHAHIRFTIKIPIEKPEKTISTEQKEINI